MTPFLSSLLLTATVYLAIVNGVSYEINFDRIELVNSSYLEGYYNISTLRIGKFNRTTYAFSAEFETFFEFNEKVFVEVEAYYNRLNNNQYQLSLFRVKKQSFCKFFELFYKNYTMSDFKNISNLPQYAPNEKVCPFKKVIEKMIQGMMKLI